MGANRLLLLVAALLLACRPAAESEQPREPGPVEAAGRGPVETGDFALVSGGTRLFLGPTLDSPSVELDEEWVGFKVVVVGEGAGEGDLWPIVLRRLPHEDASCFGGLMEAPAELQVWVEPEGLVDVVRRDVTVELGDGTAVRLIPGLAVIPTDAAGEVRVRGPGLAVSLPLPTDVVGKRFDAVPRLPGGKAPGIVPPGRRFGLGRDRLVDVSRSWLYGKVGDGPANEDRTGESKEGPYPEVADFGAPDGLVRVRMRCAEITARLVEAPETDWGPSPSRFSPSFLDGESSFDLRLEAGMTLRWPQGGLAGKTVAMDRPVEGTNVGSGWCFQVLRHAHPPLGACVAADELPPGPGAIRIVEVDVEGPLDEDVVTKGLEGQVAGLMPCVRHLVEPGEDTIVTLTLSVGAKGVVTWVRDHGNSHLSRQRTTCMARGAEKWTFPAASGTSEVQVEVMVEDWPAAAKLR